MIKFSDSITINQSVEKVFNFLADLRNLPQWQTGVIKSEVVTEGPIRVGTKFNEEVKMIFVKLPTVCEVTQFVPLQKMAFTANSSAIAYQGNFEFQKEGENSTKILLNADISLKGLWKLFGPMFSYEVEKETKKELQNLKIILEKS